MGIFAITSIVPKAGICPDEAMPVNIVNMYLVNRALIGQRPRVFTFLSRLRKCDETRHNEACIVAVPFALYTTLWRSIPDFDYDRYLDHVFPFFKEWSTLLPRFVCFRRELVLVSGNKTQTAVGEKPCSTI